MMEFAVSRAYLKNACDQRQWDLLDRLLGCVIQKQIKGVQVLLDRGQSKSLIVIRRSIEKAKSGAGRVLSGPLRKTNSRKGS